MALQGKYESQEQIPEAVREHYVQDGNAWVLDSPDVVPRAKLNEFRDNNLKLQKALKEKEELFGSVDVEEYQKLREQATKNRERKLIEADKVEELYAERLAPIKSEKERIEKELSSKLTAAESKLAELMIDNTAKDLAMKAGVRATAVPDVMLRVRAAFKFDGEKVLPANGEFGKNGEPLSMAEWMGTLVNDAPHLFEASNGGGASKAGQSRQALGPDTISRADQAAYLANLDKIASGQMKVK